MDTKKFLALVEKKKKEAEKKHVATAEWAKKLENAANKDDDTERKKRKKDKKRRKHSSGEGRRKRDSSSSSDSTSEGSDSEAATKRKRKKRSKRHDSTSDCTDSDPEEERRKRRERLREKKERRKSRERSHSSGEKKRRKHQRHSTEPYSSNSDSGSDGGHKKQKSRYNDQDLFDNVKRHQKSKSRTPEPLLPPNVVGKSLPQLENSSNLPPLPPRRKSITPEPRYVAVGHTSPMKLGTTVEEDVAGASVEIAFGSVEQFSRSQKEIEDDARKRALASMAIRVGNINEAGCGLAGTRAGGEMELCERGDER